MIYVTAPNTLRCQINVPVSVRFKRVRFMLYSNNKTEIEILFGRKCLTEV